MKRHAPATQRNREPILDVLSRVLPSRGVVLEIASGSGQHAMFFAEKLPELRWQPSDVDAEARASIEAYREEGPKNVLAPLAIDTRRPPEEWGTADVDAIFCANMIHIAPWACCEGLMRGAGRLLRAGGVLVLYGPFKRNGEHTAPSNASFDEGLRARDPSWGVRDLEAVIAEASANGLVFREEIAMPANNLTLVFARAT